MMQVLLKGKGLQHAQKMTEGGQDVGGNKMNENSDKEEKRERGLTAGSKDCAEDCNWNNIAAAHLTGSW